MKNFGQLNSFINVDLHIHTIESKYKDKKIVDESDINHLDVILNALNNNGINLFSFADHNRFNLDIYNKTIEILDSEIGQEKYPNIKNILASVEFDVQIDNGNPACHILTIFDAKTSDDRKKIKEEIDKDKLTSPDDYYSLKRYVELLSNIGLSTILIACQRKDIGNKKKDNLNSLSDSCDDVVEFLKTGFISSFEYQKPNVEGILINSLSKFDEGEQISLVANSDCHEWTAYPNHHKGDKRNDKSWYFEIKAQPTFLGLLMAVTSPQTRFKRENTKIPYIKGFVFNNEIHHLSPGFNAIIGENGSGKSSLLSLVSPNQNDSSATHIKKIKKQNGFSVIPGDDCSSITKYIKQGDLVDRTNKDSLFASDIVFPQVDNSKTINSIKTYANALFKKIEANIQYETNKSQLKTSTFILNSEYEGCVSFYVNIVVTKGFADTSNQYKDPLNSIIKIINNLISFDKSLLSNEEKENIFEAILRLKKAEKSISDRYTKVEYINSVKSIISSEASTYNSNVKKASSAHDTRMASYKNSKQEFVDKIVETIKSQLNINVISLPNLIEKDSGVASITKQGFRFISTAKYNSIDDVKGDLLSSVFNTAYKQESVLLGVNNNEILKAAISNCGPSGNCKDKFMENVNKYINGVIEENHSIVEIGSTGETGGTLGEQSLAYYKFITNADAKDKIILIDQPEDNISVPGIMKKLIDYLNKLRDKKQIIFVTHSPLLVINLDVDNVIYLKKQGDLIECKSGCLEADNIIEYVEENLDGGKEALRKRLKVYE